MSLSLYKSTTGGIVGEQDMSTQNQSITLNFSHCQTKQQENSKKVPQNICLHFPQFLISIHI